MIKWTNSWKFETINKLLNLVSILLIVSVVAITFIYWLQAPNTIPMHYNIKGEIDRYGSKNAIFFTLFIVLILYTALFMLGKHPELYNFVIKITPENKEKQFNMATAFIKVLNIELVSIFFYIQVNELISLKQGYQNLPITFLPITSIVILGTIVFYIYKSIKSK